MNRSRGTGRQKRQTKNSEKTADAVNGAGESGAKNGQNLDDIDLWLGSRSRLYPIYVPANKKVNTHNLAEIPSLQSDEDSIGVGLDNSSQHSESSSGQRKTKQKRHNANGLIESRNRFRQLLNQMQAKTKPNNTKSDSNFDGYELKSRRVKFEHRKSKRDLPEPLSPSKLTTNEFCVKLFEKTVDLSGYCKQNPNQYFSLYPICRMWARSSYGIGDSFRFKRQSPPSPMLEPIDPDGPYSDQPVDVLHMPKPDPLPVDEKGNVINLRIPKWVREYKPVPKPHVAKQINSMAGKSAQEMLQLSLPHWRNVRRDFIAAARENEARYRHSFQMLRSMFEKSNHMESSTNVELSYLKYPPYESDATTTQ